MSIDFKDHGKKPYVVNIEDATLQNENYRTTMKVANAIEAGELYVNRTPADPYQGFHAGWRKSGIGGADGKHGLMEYLQTHVAYVQY